MKSTRALRVAAIVSLPLVALLALTPRLMAEETAEQVIQRAYEVQRSKAGVDGAIEVLEKYLEDHKKAGRVRYTLGSFYEQANRKADAKKTYRAIVDGDEEAASEAGYRLMNLLGFGFYMWSDRTWGPGDTPSVGINVWSQREGKHPDSFECELYKLDAAKLQADWEAKPRGLEDLLTSPPKNSATKVASWEQDWPKNGHNDPLKLEKAKGSGIYVLVAKPHGIPFRMPVVVASHALVVKRSTDQLLVFAADRVTGAPLPGIKLQTFHGKLVELGTTGKDGTWSGKTATNDVISAWSEGSLAASHGWAYGHYGVGSLFAHFSTDRPIYRPGHKVHWKAIVRAHGDGDYTLPDKDRTFNVVVHDPNGAEVWKGDLKANSYGTFEGTVELKEGCPLGHYSVNLSGLGYYQFRVEEYRKPEYQVKVEAPAFVVQGDSFKAKIAAKYYYGAPVTKAEVHWEIYRRPHWRPWWTLFPCRDTWFYDDEMSPWGYHYGHGNLVKQGNGALAADGTLSVDVTVDRPEVANNHWQDEAITVVARVVDASRREESGSAEVLAPRASFSVYAQPERWVYRPGDEVTLQVRAMDPESKPRAGVVVKTTAQLREYHREKGGWTATKEVASTEGTTDAAGNVQLKLSADARGSLEVTVMAKDEKGREVKAQCWVWLADEMWASPTHAGIECILDKRSYTVGETATILCTMPQDKGSALVTREREGISSYSVESWEKGVLLLKAKIEEKDVPNFYMTVNVVSNALHAGTAEVVVIPEKKLLDVTVSFDKPTYQPKEKAIVKVKAVDRTSRKGVKCEVALGVVDASLYALATDPAIDLRKFFYKKRPLGVSTNSSFQWWVQGRAGGNAAMQEASADSAGGAPRAPAKAAAPAERRARGDEAKKEKGGDSLVEAEVRSEFPDTWVWKGTLETDENGEATVELVTPDSLTTWRATARAISRETQVGSSTAEANVFLPVLVRTEQPRFLVQGDVGGISALVHNYLDKGKKTKLSWKTTGPVRLGAPTITGGEVIEVQDGFAWVAIPSLGEVRIDWFSAKAEKPGAVILEVTAQTDEASDAMRTPAFPVLAHGAPRFASWAGALDDKESETIKLELPEGSIAEALALDLTITPSIAATMLDSLQELAGYPYGCVEQTMSRFLPDVVALDALRKLSVDDPKLRAELPKMIVAGLDRLRGFQHGDGGWGWWENDATHPYMTAYVVYGLSLARQADVRVDESMYQRGVSSLETQLAGKAVSAHGGGEEDPNARAYMIFCLAQAKKVDSKQLGKVFKNRDKLSSYGKAVLARALWRMDEKDSARTVCEELVKAASTTGSTCFWDVEAGCHGWMSLNTETTAQALHALEECGEGKELWTKTIKWLVSKRRGRWWYSTKDTAMAVYALCEHLVRTNELDADEEISITVGDKELVTQHVDKTNVLSTRVGLKLGAADLGGARTVTFKRKGKGNAYFQANLRTTSFEEDLKESPGAISVKRTIEVVHREKDGTEKRFALGKEPLAVGDELHVSLAVQASAIQEYLLVEDPIPAGCEFIREDLKGEQHGGGAPGPRRGNRGRGPQRWGWSYWYAHREYRDDRLAVCATWLDARHEYKIDYVLRCERPGDFHVLPTRAIDMYNPDVGGTGAEVRLSIR